MKLEARPVDYYLTLIAQTCPDFRDDGLSWFPDWLYRFVLRHNLTPAGRVHDWHYCTRAHGAGTMTQAFRKHADKLLRQHARELLPWTMQLAPLLLFAGVRFGGGTAAFDSCGPEAGERCRHNLTAPTWFATLG